LLGIDLVKIERIKKAVDRHGECFLKKFLDEEEIEASKNISSIAAKWAAKEAVSKALGCGISARLGFLDIKIRKSDAGAPFAVLSEKASKEFGASKVHLSITHDGEYAVAAAFVYPPPTN
jgi:holo-[acyl-carrier protein] synthase